MTTLMLMVVTTMMTIAVRPTEGWVSPLTTTMTRRAAATRPLSRIVATKLYEDDHAMDSVEAAEPLPLSGMSFSFVAMKLDSRVVTSSLLCLC